MSRFYVEKTTFVVLAASAVSSKSNFGGNSIWKIWEHRLSPLSRQIGQRGSGSPGRGRGLESMNETGAVERGDGW